MICRTQDDVLMTDSPKMASHNFDEQSDSDINLASVVSSGKNSRINQSRNVKVRNDNYKELQNLVGKKRQERSGGRIQDTPLDDNALNLGSSGLMTLKISSGRPSLIHGQEVVKEVRVCQSSAGSTATFAEAVKSKKNLCRRRS